MSYVNDELTARSVISRALVFPQGGRQDGDEAMGTTSLANGRAKVASAGPFLRRVKVRNYKSLTNCQVKLAPLSVRVGRNGSGERNFLDALRFLVDALRTTLDQQRRRSSL